MLKQIIIWVLGADVDVNETDEVESIQDEIHENLETPAEDSGNRQTNLQENEY